MRTKGSRTGRRCISGYVSGSWFVLAVSIDGSTELECTPVPIPWYAHGHLGGMLVSALDRCRCGGGRARGCRVRAVSHRRTVAGSLAIGTTTPGLEGQEAVGACTARRTPGVVVGVLVEGNVVR